MQRQIGAIALATALAAGCSQSSTPRLIVLVSIDTLTREAVRAYNPAAPELPNIDRFASKSTVFSHAYATAPWTLPSHASMLTGLYPDKHLARIRRARMSPFVWKLVPALQKAGYATVAYTDGGFVSDHYFGEGFDRYNDKNRGGIDIEGLPRNGNQNTNRGKDLFDRAIKTLETLQPNEKPLFLFLQTYAVHDYFKQNTWSARASGIRPRKLDTIGCVQGRITCSREDWARLNAYYHAEIRHLDDAFGGLLAAIDAASEDNVVIFVSDHGEGFDPANGRIHHGGRLHADLIHVPLIVRGLRSAAMDQTVISLADIAPTIAQLADVTPPDGLDGRSFTRPRSPEPRAILAMEYFHWWALGRRHAVKTTPNKPLSFAIIDGDQWYVTNRKGPEELYDTAVDAPQLHNLAPLVAESALADLRAHTEERTGIDIPASITEVPDEVNRELESLGYIEK